MFQNYYNFKIVRTEHGAQELKKTSHEYIFSDYPCNKKSQKCWKINQKISKLKISIFTRLMLTSLI